MAHVVFVDNVLLQHSDTGFNVDLQPHLGLISLIAMLREGGHSGALYDPKLDVARGDLALGPAFYRTVAERIAALEPDIAGFTSLGCNFACTVQVAAELRRLLPKVPILLGGPHASILDRAILQRYSQFDAVVRGEAESTIGEVVDAYAAGALPEQTSGLTYRRAAEIVRTDDGSMQLDLDALPYPAYDAYPIAELGLTSLRVDAGRGCPFACTFCSTAEFFGRRYRLRAADALVERLDRLAATYGITSFELMHDLFTVDKRKVRAFCRSITGRRYTWSCSARMDCVDDELLAEMRAAGCTSIYYGVETGSPRLQAVVEKRLNLDLYERRLDVSLSLGFETTVSFITGYPQETPADQDATLALMARTIEAHRERCTVQLHLLTPEPGTALLRTHAAALAYDGHVGEFNFPPLGLDDELLIAADPDVFVCHRYYAAEIERARNIDATDGYRLLYVLGHGVLAALVAAAGRPFAALVIEAGRVLRESGLTPPLALTAFIRGLFGAGSPFEDVAAALSAAAQARPETRRPILSWTPQTRLLLAANVIPVGVARDGFAVAHALGRDGYINPADFPAQPALLIAGRDAASRRIFAIDEPLLALAQTLAEPRTFAELEPAYAPGELHWRLWALAMLGAIVDAADPHGASKPSLRSISGSALPADVGGTNNVDITAMRA